MDGADVRPTSVAGPNAEIRAWSMALHRHVTLINIYVQIIRPAQMRAALKDRTRL